MKREPNSSNFRYSGADNLEVMAEARNYNHFLLDLVRERFAPSARILDFGAGCGTFAIMLRASGYEVSCVEPDPGQAAALQEQGFETAQSCGELNSASFDAIYTFNVLEHIGDDEAAARDLMRVLRPGGRLLVYVPAFDLLFGEMDRKVGHHRRYRSDTLTGLLIGAGFVMVRCAYADSLGFIATLAFNAFGSKDGTLNAGTVKLYDRIVFPASRLLDRVVSKFFGKNVYALVQKPAGRK